MTAPEPFTPPGKDDFGPCFDKHHKTLLARIKELEARLEAVKAICWEELFGTSAPSLAAVLASRVFQAAEGKP